MIDSAKPDYQSTPVSPKRPRFNYSSFIPVVSPQVTIVTPFYNTGLIFHETARSVLQQSFQQWEWLIINDGSTDTTALVILDAYRHGDSRIRVIDHDTNRGPSAARNTGYSAAQAPYVVQLDSDNLLEPTAIEKWYWFLESYPEFSFCKGYSVGFGAEEYLWDRGFHNGPAFLKENQVDATSMVRKAVHQAAKGYDESIRDGLEDWDFWLRCASLGYWGATVPEYLDWYRRRPTHSDRWKNWDRGEKEKAFAMQLRLRYPELWDRGFPQIQPRWHMPNDTVPDGIPCHNVLGKSKRRRLLMIVPWLKMGGADKFNLDLSQQLSEKGWEITIATTLSGEDSWQPYFARYTSDIFILHHFLRLVDYPRFLRYLIQSRQVDVVLISHSEMAYQLLLYLRAHFSKTPFVDFCHIEEEWKNGGYPRMAVEYQEMLDMTIVASEHLKQWMVQHSAESEQIHVCYINVDPEVWRPDPEQRVKLRRELGLEEMVPIILYAGRICLQKQPRVFASTMLKLRQLGVPFTALVAGDGPDLNWLRSFVVKHKLSEQVRLLAAVSIDRMQQLLAAADMFFLPSQQEGIALSIYEAMASELVVVSADVGGQQELVTPDCGVLIVRSNEETEAAQYTETLAELLQDSQRRARMGRAGRARVIADFRLEDMGKRMAELLEQAMNLQGTRLGQIPSFGLGRAYAAQAVEYFRMAQLAERLWNERNGSHALWNALNGPGWRIQIYALLRSLYEPLYIRGVKRGGAWYFPVAEKIKGMLLRPR
jgi:glycosyltransferase involved in cell wall biosynthesis/GT2 family glycosyltransferase